MAVTRLSFLGFDLTGVEHPKLMFLGVAVSSLGEEQRSPG